MANHRVHRNLDLAPSPPRGRGLGRGAKRYTKTERYANVFTLFPAVVSQGRALNPLAA